MYVKFHNIKYKNLMSVGNDFIQINFDKNPKTLIVGRNGSSKSTILEAITFVLFGKPYRNINKPQLVNSINGKELLVEITFSIGKNNYFVRRGIKPNIFEIYKNDNLIEIDAKLYDYQSVLEKILKTNYKTFCQIVVLGSANYTPFMGLTKPLRREIIEELFDLNIFSSMNALLKDKEKIINKEMDAENTNKRIIEEKIKLTQQHINKIQNNNEQIIEEKKNKSNDLLEEILRYKNNIETIELDILDIQPLVKDEKKLNSKYSKLLEYETKINGNISKLSDDNEFYNHNNDCPTCRQSIDSAFKCEIIDKNTKEMEKFNVGLSQLSKEKIELEEILVEIQEHKSKIRELEFDRNSFENKKSSAEKYKKEIDKEIEKLSETVNVQEEQEKLTELEIELDTIKKSLDSINYSKDVMSVASTFLKDEGIKANIIKRYIPVINKLINKYLGLMNFNCYFNLDENFSEVLKSRYRDDFIYNSFSQGEKQRIDLSILFAFLELSKLRNTFSTNLLIMDEIFESSLEKEGIDDLNMIINDLTKDTNVFIISHQESLVEKFHHVLKFKKVKNFSYMEEVNG